MLSEPIAVKDLSKVTNELIGEITSFNPAKIAAEAKAYK